VVLGHDRTTFVNAKDMVKKGVAFMKIVGKDVALIEFNKPKSHYIHKDVHIFATDDKGLVLAHPINPALIGKNIISLKDADGNMFIKQAIESVKKNGGSCAVEYRWFDPQTKKLETKETYAEIVKGVVLFGVSYK
jgi:hypothetical protein